MVMMIRLFLNESSPGLVIIFALDDEEDDLFLLCFMTWE